MQKYDFGQEKWLLNREYPSEERRRMFIREYIAECKRSGHFDDWDDEGLDSEDHILLESEFCSMACRLMTFNWCLNDIVAFGRMQDGRKEVDPEFTQQVSCLCKCGANCCSQGGVASLVYFYRELKESFLKKYPQYA